MVWFVLAALLILATISGLGATYLLAQAASPAQVASQLCDDLSAQRYDAAAYLLSTPLRAADGQVTFVSAMTALDGAEGPVMACHEGKTSAGAGGSVDVPLAITRGKLGDLAGTLRLEQENGSWLVTSLPTSLLGVDKSALQVTLAYCSDLRAGDYQATYALLAPQARAGLSATGYAERARTQDIVDGVTRSCALAAVGQNNTDAATQLTITLTRAQLAARTGVITLSVTAGAWHITSVDSALQGTDLGPLSVGESFCSALARGVLGDAYALTNADYQQRVPLPQFAALLARPGARLGGCLPDLTTYHVAGTTATYTVAVTYLGSSPSEQATQPLRLSFDWETSGWRISDVTHG
jgi:hypothetical protein